MAGAVRACAAGETLLAATVTKRLIENFVQRPPTPSAGEVPALLKRLTPRELEVLRAIAHGKSNNEVGAELFLSEPTVKTHVTHILAKLELRDRVQAIVLAYEVGLVAPHQP